MDQSFWPFEFLLTRSKNRSYREHIVASTESLVGFLERNNLVLPRASGVPSRVTELFSDFFTRHRDQLIVRTLPRTEPAIPAKLVIYESDLSPEGRLLMKNALDRWLKAQDRGLPRHDVSILERELKKIRTRIRDESEG